MKGFSMDGLTQPMNEVSQVEETFVSSWCTSRGKRCFDFALAGLLLVLSAPLQVMICIAIKAISRGPVLFRQLRTGRNGNPFIIYKFRTMNEGQGYSSSSFTRPDDPRITRLGRTLRRTKLDEFPQLINILKGEMSFVGPRPRVPAQVGSLLSTRPGLTGIASLIFADEEKVLQKVPDNAQEQYHAQVLNPLKLRYDLQYVEAATLSLDIEIIVRTVIKVYLSPLKGEMDLQTVNFEENNRNHSDNVGPMPAVAPLSAQKPGPPLAHYPAMRRASIRSPQLRTAALTKRHNSEVHPG
jgi:lipopolysaccharide/colanic/teichoic acid biosynthesis glycosyltransferase